MANVYDLTVAPKNYLCIDARQHSADEFEKVCTRAGLVGWPIWGGATLPKVGDRVVARGNNLGPGTVVGYFVEHGFLGVRIKPEARPAWHVKQNPGREVYNLFAIEIEAST